MIFPVMMFSLGFLCAFLLAIVILPPFIRKSGQKPLTAGQKKRLTSLKQSRAESDRMRAEYAISIRKQEQAAEVLKARGQQQLIEIAECRAVIREQKREMSDITALADRRYQENAQLQARLAMVERTAAQPHMPAGPQAAHPIPAGESGGGPPADGTTVAGSQEQIAEKTPEAAAPDGPEPETDGKPRLPGTKKSSGKASKADGAKSRGLAGRIQRLKMSS